MAPAILNLHPDEFVFTDCAVVDRGVVGSAAGVVGEIPFPVDGDEAGCDQDPFLIRLYPPVEVAGQLPGEQSVHEEAFQEAGFRTAWLTNKSRAMYLQRVLDCMDERFETGKDMSTRYKETSLGGLAVNISNC